MTDLVHGFQQSNPSSQPLKVVQVNILMIYNSCSLHLINLSMSAGTAMTPEGSIIGSSVIFATSFAQQCSIGSRLKEMLLKHAAIYMPASGPIKYSAERLE